MAPQNIYLQKKLQKTSIKFKKIIGFKSLEKIHLKPQGLLWMLLRLKKK